MRPSIYYQLTRDGAKPEGESSFYYTYTGPAIYTDEDKFHKVPFDDVADQRPVKADNGWVAMIQHYFLSAWADVRGENVKVQRELYTSKLDNDLYAVGSIVRRIRRDLLTSPTAWIWWWTTGGSPSSPNPSTPS